MAEQTEQLESATTIESPVSPKVVEVTNRKDAIAEALKAVGDPQQVEVEETLEKPAEKKIAAPVAKTAEVKEVEEKKLAQAVQLFDALNNPEQAPAIIAFLAQQAGYTKAEAKAAAKTEVAAEALKDDITAILKESLGEEFGFLADKFGPALEKIINSRLESSTKDIRDDIQKREAEKLEVQSATVITSLTDGFFGKGESLPAEVNAEMSKYMDRILPGPKTTIAEYLEDAFNASVAKLGLSKSDKVKQERTNKNRTDAGSRLASARVPAEEGIRQDNSKPLTRKQAIAQAVEHLGSV